MNFDRPITPATTGPVSMPMRTSNGRPLSAAQRSASGRISSAISAIASAWSSRGSGMPAAAMYASPIVLIFSTPCLAASASQRANTLSSSATTSAGGEPARQRREAGDVGEQHGDGVVGVGDHPLLPLQPRRDRGREDVQQQALRPGLLALARAHEVLEQQIGRGGRRRGSLSPKNATTTPLGMSGALGRDGRVDPDGHADEGREGDEPRDGLARAHEQQRPQRRRERPQRDGRRSSRSRRGSTAAQTAAAGSCRAGCGGTAESGKCVRRRRCCPPTRAGRRGGSPPAATVRARRRSRPNEGQARHQSRRQRQHLLANAQLVRVRRADADSRQPLQQRGDAPRARANA